MLRFLAALLVAVAAVVASQPASADSRTYFSFSTTVGNGPGYYRHGYPSYRGYYGPRHYGPSYYGPSYYGPRVRYYYAPPPVIYAPPPAVVYAPPPPVVVVPQQTCQVFHGDAVIDASGRPFYGTACLRGDGRWHIIN